MVIQKVDFGLHSCNLTHQTSQISKTHWLKRKKAKLLLLLESYHHRNTGKPLVWLCLDGISIPIKNYLGSTKFMKNSSDIILKSSSFIFSSSFSVCSCLQRKMFTFITWLLLSLLPFPFSHIHSSIPQLFSICHDPGIILGAYAEMIKPASVFSKAYYPEVKEDFKQIN